MMLFLLGSQHKHYNELAVYFIARCLLHWSAKCKSYMRWRIVVRVFLTSLGVLKLRENVLKQRVDHTEPYPHSAATCTQMCSY